MSTRPRLCGALDVLFTELEEVAAWEREIAAEARRAASRRERLAQSLRCTIDTLDLCERGPWHARLRAVLGNPEVPPIPCQTPRIRLALDWLARRETPEFTIGDLRAHLAEQGETFSRGYLPALLDRWGRAGVVARLGHGRYRVNGERLVPAGRSPEASA